MSTATFAKLPRYTWTDADDNVNPSRVSYWEVSISYDHPVHPGCYGYFEHDVHGEGGGLWFERHDSGAWELSDYDGCSSLPKSVWMTLRNAGFVVSSDFE
jgi:hypothetical protein